MPAISLGSQDGDWVIFINDIINLLNLETQRKFGQLKLALPDIGRNCRWLTHCRGGCPKERGFEP